MSGAGMAVVGLGHRAIEVAGSFIERSNFLEENARLCYAVWSERIVGPAPSAWEALRECEREGWRDVVRFFQEAPECRCGTGLMCIDCDRAELRGILAELPADAEDEPRRCRNCRCTDDVPYPGGCSWVAEDLCSSCVDKVPVLCSEAEMNAYIRQLRAVAP